MIVTSTPIVRADAATSQPIQPAPMIARRAPGCRRSRSAAQSASVRSSRMASSSEPGSVSRRGRAPVASSRLS